MGIHYDGPSRTHALNKSKLEEEAGQWSAAHTKIWFEINSELLQIALADAEIAGDRVLFDYLEETQ